MPNYTTADEPLAYDQTGYYPGKKQPWTDTAAEIATFGIFDPNNKDATKRNRQITQAQTEQNLARAKADEVRTEAAKNIQALANNLVQFTGMDKVEALKRATQHYTQHSADAADEAQNANTTNEAKGAAPYAAKKGAAHAQDYIGAAEANLASNNNVKRQQQARGKSGIPELQAEIDVNTGQQANSVAKLGAIQANRAIGDDALQNTLLEQSGGAAPIMLGQIQQKQLERKLALAKTQGALDYTTADNNAQAGEIKNGTFAELRKAGQALPFNQHLGPGAAVVNALTGKKVEQPALPVGMYQKGTDANGEAIYGVYRGVMAPSTADKVAQPIPPTSGAMVIRREDLRPKNSNVN